MIEGFIAGLSVGMLIGGVAEWAVNGRRKSSTRLRADRGEVSMKLYQSHKRVHAAPMTLGGFAEYAKVSEKGRVATPSHGDPNAEGYLVIYNRGTEDHYESWSPKHVFEDGYTEVAD